MKTKKKIKTSPADKAFTVCNTIFMVLFLIITLYPILNTLALAFNDGTDALRGGIFLAEILRNRTYFRRRKRIIIIIGG